jgi:hypothetical protein
LAPGPIAAPRPNIHQQQVQATMVDLSGPHTVIRVDTPANAVTSALSPQPTAPGQGQLQGLLWGLIVVGGLIAVGLGAAVALLSRSSGSGDSVVVVGDNVHKDNTSEPRAADLGNPNTSAPVALATAPLEGAPSTVPTEDTRAGQGAAPRTLKASDPNRSKQLTAAVQRQSGAYQSCFSQNLDSSGKAPEVTLHFSVAKQGGAAQVKVEPQSLATTPLGSCLLAAGSRVQFPQLDEAVAFRVPVRARVSRGKGTE